MAFADLNIANIFNIGPQTIQTGNDNNKGLVVRANSASQSVNLFEVQTSSSVGVAWIDKDGGISGNSLVANSLMAPDKGSQVYNVKSYGAVGDGVTDDTTAIQNAFDTVAASGGTILFPPRHV